MAASNSGQPGSGMSGAAGGGGGAAAAAASGVRTQFKTPEGRYRLSHEKSSSAGLLHYGTYRSITKVTVAHLKDRPPSTPTAASSSSSSGGGSGSVAGRFAPSRLLANATGGASRSLGFGSSGGGSGNGFVRSSKGSAAAGLGAFSPAVAAAYANGPVSSGTASPDIVEVTYLIYNAADVLYVADLNTPEKDPLKALHFSHSQPICHAFDAGARDGSHDLVIGCASGDVYTCSLRQQVHDVGRKLVGAAHHNKDGGINTR
eukprot:SM003845S14675  [mRNA]  locus=s3845:143:1302:+ [translate_table: standard]